MEGDRGFGEGRQEMNDGIDIKGAVKKLDGYREEAERARKLVSALADRDFDDELSAITRLKGKELAIQIYSGDDELMTISLETFLKHLASGNWMCADSDELLKMVLS